MPQISNGAGVVTTRADMHYVVTEYGVAYLHGKNVRQRAEALIQIAHPKFREELTQYLREMGLGPNEFRRYGEVKMAAEAKGNVEMNQDECKGCGLCVESCPAHALELSPELESLRSAHRARSRLISAPAAASATTFVRSLERSRCTGAWWRNARCAMRQLCKGNVAVVKAALMAGCRAFYGYPITPASEIAEYAALLIPQAGGTFVQAESEVSAINMVYGAAAAGQRVMTASSGPGMSLMQEGISYLAGAELPCVIADVMRAGPGLGNIAPEQSDYFAMTKGGGHGCYRNIVLAPSSVQEMASLTMLAFELADKYRNPAVLLADGFVGQMMEPLDLELIEAEPAGKTLGGEGHGRDTPESDRLHPSDAGSDGSPYSPPGRQIQTV